MSTSRKILRRDFVKSRTRRPITLIEILLVIALITLIGGVLTWNIRGLTREQQFQQAVEIVTDKFQTAQNIMIILDSDVDVEMKKIGKEMIMMDIRPEKALTAPFEKILEQNRRIQGIESYSFDEITDEPVLFHFSALSQKTPYGQLELVGNNQKKVLSFFGHPHFIETTNNPKNIEEPENESALLYPKEIRELWQEKLESKK